MAGSFKSISPGTMFVYFILIGILVRSGYGFFELVANEFSKGDILILLSKIFLLSIGFIVAAICADYIQRKNGNSLYELTLRIFLIAYNLLTCVTYFQISFHLNTYEYGWENLICGIVVLISVFFVTLILQGRVSNQKNYSLPPRLLVIMLHFFMILNKYSNIDASYFWPLLGEIVLLIVMVAASLLTDQGDLDKAEIPDGNRSKSRTRNLM
jgi:hypothetical protein